MAKRPAPSWCLSLAVPQVLLPVFEAALEQLGGAMVTSGPDQAGSVPVQVYLAVAPDRVQVTALMAAAGLAAGVEAPAFSIAQLPDTDWVAESQRALPPLRFGRFYIFGAHVTDPPPADAIPLLVEANVAFGTGRHESTQGCLEALSALAAQRAFTQALDMGCGSGILAMAIAKLWACPVLAVDNDADSIRVAAENAELNGVSASIRTVCGDGYKTAAVGEAGPFDLIVANILAEPLSAMAPELKNALAPGGVALLSGLLIEQEEGVLASHAPLRLIRHIHLNGWATLILSL